MLIQLEEGPRADAWERLCLLAGLGMPLGGGWGAGGWASLLRLPTLFPADADKWQKVDW